jgi:hypothetical protein
MAALRLADRGQELAGAWFGCPDGFAEFACDINAAVGVFRSNPVDASAQAIVKLGKLKMRARETLGRLQE